MTTPDPLVSASDLGASVDAPSVDAVPPRPGLGGPFWRLFTASSTTYLSDGVLTASLPLLAATLSRNPVTVSALAALAFLPWLLFGIVSGALVDRVNRRTAMAVSDFARAGVLAVLAVLVLTGVVNIPILYAAAFAVGSVETVYDNAARSMLPAVVTTAQLERGNSLLTTAEGVGTIFLGAPIGAALFVVAASLPFWGNAAAYLIAALVILTLRGSFRIRRAEPTSLGADVREGLRWLWHHRLLRSLMVVVGISAMAQALVNGILVLYALQNLGLSERGFGILLAAAGVGAIIGSIASPAITAMLGRTVAMGACQSLSAAAIIVLGLVDNGLAGMLCFAVSAAGVSAFNVQIMSLRQAVVPEELFGRVQGAYRTVIWGGIPIGSLLGGVLGHAFGLPAVCVISGAVGVVAGLAVWAALHRDRSVVQSAFAGADSRVTGDG